MTRSAWPYYLATRFLGLALLLPETAVLVWPAYAHLALTQLGSVQGLWEYPWPMAALLDLPLRLGATGQWAYVASWLLLALAVDAGFALLLWRAVGKRLSSGLLLWLLVLPVLGPLLLATPDIIPAAASAAALLAVSRARPAWGGALLALGTAAKLWPLLALPAAALPAGRAERARLLLVFALAGLSIAAVTVAAGGLERLWSPLIWQQRRGLQVEALAALPLLWARHFDPGSLWTTPMSAFNCYEIQGPGVALALQAGPAAMLLTLAGVALLHLRAFRAPASARTTALAVKLILVTLLALIATNKVLSPQYLVWLAAPLAVLGVLPGSPLARVDAALFLTACALTQLVYPLNYDGLVAAGRTSAWILGALTLRDLLLAALALRLAQQAWRETARV